MAKAKGYLDYLRHNAAGVQVLGTCPITCGLPTRMTAAGFARACKARREMGEDRGGEPLQASAVAAFKVRKKMDVCAECRGKRQPAELELIELTEGDMVVSKKNANCESCGKGKLNLSSCSGDVVCSSCAAVYGAINNRLPILAAAVRRLGKADQLVAAMVAEQGQEWVLKVLQPYVPETVAVKLENDTLEQIAKLVSYDGESGEGLIEAVSVMALAAARQEMLMDGPPEDLVRALDLPNDATVSQVWLAAIQTAALLDSAQHNKFLNATFLARAKADLETLQTLREKLGDFGGSFDPITALAELTNAFYRHKNRAEALVAENTILADRVSELETAQAVHEQVLEQIGEVVHCEGCHPGELPSRVAAALVGGPLLPQPTLSAPPACPLDSHLLDLVLEFPGIPLERIALIREAV